MSENIENKPIAVKQPQDQQQVPAVKTHFVLSIVAICLSCFSGFFTIPLALAALILSLRAQDLVGQNRLEEAARFAYWAAVFGWITVAVAILPLLIFIFFGGAILAALAALVGAAAA